MPYFVLFCKTIKAIVSKINMAASPVNAISNLLHGLSTVINKELAQPHACNEAFC